LVTTEEMPVNYLMLTYFTEEAALRWEQLDEAGRQADVGRHRAWFADRRVLSKGVCTESPGR
jgi:hypothetical protein